MLNEEVRQWLVSYAAQTQQPEELDRLITLLDNATFPAVPQLEADEVASAELRTIIRARAQDFLAALKGDLSSSHSPQETLDWARAVARRGHGLGVVLTAYRAGQRALWDYVTSMVEEQIPDAELRAAVLTAIWDRATLWADTTMDAVVATYSKELEQWQRGASGDRMEAVQTILRGDTVNLDQTSDLLGHALHLNQTAVVVWADGTYPDDDRPRRLDEIVHDLAAALGGKRPLVVAMGTGGMSAWIATPGTPKSDALIDLVLPVGIRVAVGSSWPGLVGFRRSHREALATQRIAVTGRHGRQVTRYEDVELVCFATGDGSIDATRALVSRELKELAAIGKTPARLRETALIYLSYGEDARAVGERLSIQPSTVRHRIQQVEQLLGHPIGVRRSHVELALRCVEEFGDQVLPAEGPSRPR
ncbi:PucR family transcriptional regulator [Rhodococcus koreensis]